MGSAGARALIPRSMMLALLFGALAIIVATMALRASGNGQERYEAAVYDVGPAPGGQQRLRIFSLNASVEKAIPVPVQFSGVAFSPSGKLVYFDAPTPRPGDRPVNGIFKFNPEDRKLILIPGSNRFAWFSAFAATDRGEILFSGGWQPGHCGIFELAQNNPVPIEVIGSSNCDPRETWNSLSISPDGSRAAAVRRHTLELIDVIKRSIRPISSNVVRCAWSPDGKWLAARDNDEDEKTVLFETARFVKGRILPESALAWSPDSKYLLAEEPVGCMPYYSTLVRIDVGSGRAVPVLSSACRISGGRLGWLAQSATTQH